MIEQIQARIRCLAVASITVTSVACGGSSSQFAPPAAWVQLEHHVDLAHERGISLSDGGSFEAATTNDGKLERANGRLTDAELEKLVELTADDRLKSYQDDALPVAPEHESFRVVVRDEKQQNGQDGKSLDAYFPVTQADGQTGELLDFVRALLENYAPGTFPWRVFPRLR